MVHRRPGEWPKSAVPVVPGYPPRGGRTGGPGAAYRGRGRWHTDQLTRLARHVARPLTLVVRGGSTQLRRLSGAFHRVAFLSGTPYVKTMKRKRFVSLRGRAGRWVPNRTGDDEALDSLLAINISGFSTSVAPLFEPPARDEIS